MGSKKCIYKTLMVCIPLVISLMIFMEAIAYILDISANHSGPGLLGLSGIMEMIIVLCIVLLLDGIITFLVIILYFTKLKNLILAKQRTNRMVSGTEIEMNETQKLFVT